MTKYFLASKFRMFAYIVNTSRLEKCNCFEHPQGLRSSHVQ